VQERQRLTTMRRLLALALTAGALTASAPAVRAQPNAPSCPPYAYYNTAVGQCVTHPTDGHGTH
jgi:hypothetical protein